jgi:predicted ATP-dependent protease
MEVDVQLQSGAEALHEGDGAGGRMAQPSTSQAASLPGEQNTHTGLQGRSEEVRPPAEGEPHRNRQREHPLSVRRAGQDAAAARAAKVALVRMLLHYMRFLSGLSHEEKLLPLTLEGAGRVLEHAARLCDDQHKLTTRFGEIADLVREASFSAQKEKATEVSASHVKQALSARADREGFIELRMREDIAQRRISIHTEGSVVGQVNGLTVIDLGSYAFGMASRITCRVGAGRGEIVDIERETELGGPIHTKGTQILKGVLLDRFGRYVPLCLQATLCMEQSYSDIDGDSASLAEVCAILSALAGIPIRQDVAVTGSIDQLGNAQAVGGVNEKIEGFFRVCRERAPDRVHEVIIPASNTRDLMLDEDVVDACAKGLFRVTTVATLEDALFVLTGERWDDTAAPKKRGATTQPGIRSRVLAALHELAAVQSIANLQPKVVRRTPLLAPARGTTAAPRGARRGRKR